MTLTPPANASASYNDRDRDPLTTDHCPLLSMNLDDTIVAIATPPGRGGIGVVRLAGPEARNIAAPMLRLKHPLEPGRAIRCDLIDPSPTHVATTHVGTDALVRPAERSSAPFDITTPHMAPARIDEVVVTYFAKPHSYT